MLKNAEPTESTKGREKGSPAIFYMEALQSGLCFGLGKRPHIGTPGKGNELVN